MTAFIICAFIITAVFLYIGFWLYVDLYHPVPPVGPAVQLRSRPRQQVVLLEAATVAKLKSERKDGE